MISPSKIPPCPEPNQYILIRSKEGTFWRKKRGLGNKGAELNEKFKASSLAMRVTAPAAKRIVARLKPYLNNLSTGRITVRISGKLRTQFNKTSKVDYTYFNGFDLQPSYPLEQLLQVSFIARVENEALYVSIPIKKQTVKQNSSNITNFYLELILISGDCTVEDGLSIKIYSSSLFSINPVKQFNCKLALPLPKKPWFASLKVCCTEGNKASKAPEDCGMKVIAVG